MEGAQIYYLQEFAKLSSKQGSYQDKNMKKFEDSI